MGKYQYVGKMCPLTMVADMGLRIRTEISLLGKCFSSLATRKALLE